MPAAAESAFLEDRPIGFSLITSSASNPEFYQIGLNSPSIQFYVMDVWSATVGFTPPSPEWNPGATIPLLVARSGKPSIEI